MNKNKITLHTILHLATIILLIMSIVFINQLSSQLRNLEGTLQYLSMNINNIPSMLEQKTSNMQATISETLTENKSILADYSVLIDFDNIENRKIPVILKAMPNIYIENQVVSFTILGNKTYTSEAIYEKGYYTSTIMIDVTETELKPSVSIKEKDIIHNQKLRDEYLKMSLSTDALNNLLITERDGSMFISGQVAAIFDPVYDHDYHDHPQNTPNAIVYPETIEFIVTKNTEVVYSQPIDIININLNDGYQSMVHIYSTIPRQEIKLSSSDEIKFTIKIVDNLGTVYENDLK